MSTIKWIVVSNLSNQNTNFQWLSEKSNELIQNLRNVVLLVLAWTNINWQNVVNWMNSIPNPAPNWYTSSINVLNNNALIWCWVIDWYINVELRINWNPITPDVAPTVAPIWSTISFHAISPSWNNTCANTSWVDQIYISQWSWTYLQDNCIYQWPLPVELTKFVAACEKDWQQVRFVELKRETASEVNNEGFWVQKSADGKTWDNVAFVKWAGSSSQAKEYGFIDTEWTEWDDDGVVYYRLEQNDFDGQIDYSDVISVRDCDSGIGYDVVLSPNPVSDILTVTLKNADNELAHTLYVFNSVWQIVWKVSASDAGKIEFDTSSLPSWIYTIKTIAWNGTDVVTKMFSKI